MSVDYDLVCRKHKEKVGLCSDGLSGPITQCDRSMAAFSITHRGCELSIVTEQDDSVDKFDDWLLCNWEDKLNYELKPVPGRVAALEKALQEIIELPSERQDECCNIAMAAMDNQS